MPHSTPVLTAFASSPDEGRGLARDMPVRWALEEVGLAYDVRLVSFAEMKEPAHLALQPFGQIPTLEADGTALFESGAIVLHVAEQGEGLLPADPAGRARAIAWMFAAVATVEPPIVAEEAEGFNEAGEPWHARRVPLMEDRIRQRLEPLSRRLGEAEWLDGAFSTGDLMMVSVLRRLGGSPVLADYANLSAYVARGEARPAFRRAFAAQAAVFAAASRR